MITSKHRASADQSGQYDGGLPDARSLFIQIFAGLACACFCLAVALYRVPLTAVAAALAGTNLVWLGAAVAVYSVNLALRARRWQMILRPVAAVPYVTVARVLVVGYGLNAIMPLRIGELFRAEFLSRLFGMRRVSALVSIIVERLLDGLTVVACLGLGLLLGKGGQRPAHSLIYVMILGGILFGTILTIALCLGGDRIPRLLARFPSLSERMIAARDLLRILRSRQVVQIALLTLVVYVPDSLSLWCIVNALGLSLRIQDILVLVGAASLSTLLPSGPGFIGTLQLAYMLALGFAGANGSFGIAAATLAQFCLFLPVAIVATGVLLQRSGSLLRAVLMRRRVEPT